jgi:hypothetical protein
MYDVNFPNIGMGEAISFLFQRTLAFSGVHRGVRSYFSFSAANLGFIGGLSALMADYWLGLQGYEAFGCRSTIILK